MKKSIYTKPQTNCTLWQGEKVMQTFSPSVPGSKSSEDPISPFGVAKRLYI